MSMRAECVIVAMEDGVCVGFICAGLEANLGVAFNATTPTQL